MFEQLIESKNHKKETAKRAKFLGTTFTLVVSLAFSGVLWSLFAKDIRIGSEQMELSTMIAPVNLPETKPQPPEPVQRQPKNALKNTVNETTRQENILRLDETPKVPNAISVVPNSQKARPNAPFKLSNAPETDFQSAVKFEQEGDNNSGGGIGNNKAETNNSEVIKNNPPPIPPPLNLKKTETVKDKSSRTVSLGVVNGKATNLPKPIYSAAAKAVNAAGEVSVQITIDERGSVISAKAVSGHILLRQDSERAARNARFSPTFLSKEAVKVTGVIVYKFSR